MKDFAPKTLLGKLLYENELRFLSTLKDQREIKSSIYRKRMFCSFSFDGDLADWIQKDKTTEAFDLADKRIKEAGFPSIKEITKRYVSLHGGTLSRISLHNLIIGKSYSLWDISALAGNFNQMLGMYASKDDYGSPIAIIKATINGISFRANNYADQWLSDNHSHMKYFLQKENDIVDFNFKNQTNRIIFDGLIKGIPVPIYVFFNEEKGVDYTYAGIFNANGISPDKKSFDIFSRETFNSQDVEMKRVDFLSNYSKQLPDIWRNKPIEEVVPPQHLSNQLKNNGNEKNQTTNPDYLTLYEVQKLIGSLGEQEAIRIEKKRLLKIMPDLAGRVSKVDLDSCGFDIRSFDIRGNDIMDIKIEVKTTSSPFKEEPFFMSENERRTMLNNNENYWLYRIFDTHASSIRYFALRNNVSQLLDLEPIQYQVRVK